MEGSPNINSLINSPSPHSEMAEEFFPAVHPKLCARGALENPLAQQGLTASVLHVSMLMCVMLMSIGGGGLSVVGGGLVFTVGEAAAAYRCH